MDGDSAAEGGSQKVANSTQSERPWPSIAASLIAALLAISTIFMHSWMTDSGTVEINTPELQGKEVDWDLNYGLWESVSHFGEEVEVTDYDCGVNDLDCKGFKTAGIVAIVLLLLGALSAITSAFLNLQGRPFGPVLRIRIGVIGSALILLSPIIWLVMLPGVFPPIEGMHVGFGFWLALFAGFAGVAGSAVSCLQTVRGVSE